MSEGNHSSHVTLVLFIVADHGVKCGKQPRGIVGNLGKTGSFFFPSSLFLVVFNAVYLNWIQTFVLTLSVMLRKVLMTSDFLSSSGVFVTSDVCRFIAETQ